MDKKVQNEENESKFHAPKNVFTSSITVLFGVENRKS